MGNIDRRADWVLGLLLLLMEPIIWVVAVLGVVAVAVGVLELWGG